MSHVILAKKLIKYQSICENPVFVKEGKLEFRVVAEKQKPDEYGFEYDMHVPIVYFKYNGRRYFFHFTIGSGVQGSVYKVLIDPEQIFATSREIDATVAKEVCEVVPHSSTILSHRLYPLLLTDADIEAHLDKNRTLDDPVALKMYSSFGIENSVYRNWNRDAEAIVVKHVRAYLDIDDKKYVRVMHGEATIMTHLFCGLELDPTQHALIPEILFLARSRKIKDSYGSSQLCNLYLAMRFAGSKSGVATNASVLANGDQELGSRTLALRVLRTLALASRKFKVVHGDLHLNNILIDDQTTPPRVSIIDWGFGALQIENGKTADTKSVRHDFNPAFDPVYLIINIWYQNMQWTLPLMYRIINEIKTLSDDIQETFQTAYVKHRIKETGEPKLPDGRRTDYDELDRLRLTIKKEFTYSLKNADLSYFRQTLAFAYAVAEIGYTLPESLSSVNIIHFMNS